MNKSYLRPFEKQMAGFIFIQAYKSEYFIVMPLLQTGDFSVSLKAPGRNKHFRVHVESGMYCIGQRKFVSLQQLVDHYQVRETKVKRNK